VRTPQIYIWKEISHKISWSGFLDRNKNQDTVKHGYQVHSTAFSSNDGVLCLDCDSRRAVGPTKTIRGVYMTQLNRLERLAALSAIREWSF
jgi:hypothetical protein